MGALIGFLFPYGDYLMGAGLALAIGAYIASLVFGFLIELFTTVVFKQAQEQPTSAAVSPAT